MDGLLLAKFEDKIIGQLGLLPVKLKHEKKIYEAQWACDLIVDPEYRKLGTGNMLFEAGMKRDKITLGNNPSPKAEVLMLKAGFNPVNSGRLMVFPIDPEQLISWAVPKKFSFAVPAIGKILKPYFTYKRKKLNVTENNFILCSWNDVAGSVKQRQEAGSCLQILHDEEFLKWRASGFQNFSPEIKAMRSSNGSYALYSYFKPYFNIYEWHCTVDSDLNSMLSVIMKLASDEKAKTIQIVSNGEREMQSLASAGFIRSRNNEKVIYYSDKIKFSSKDHFYFTLYDTDLNL